MTENEFREFLWAGHGRAAAYARTHDVGAFREVILDACLNCRAVDPQCEGTRAGYMLEFVTHLPDAAFYTDAVLDSLPQGGDDWDAVQRFHFTTYMAMEGDERAKRLVYENYRPGPRHGEWTGVNFVRLDGLPGFLFAAEKMGELLLSAAQDADEGSLMFQAEETLGKEPALNALREAALTNPRVDAYRAMIEARIEARNHLAPSVRTDGFSYQDFLDVVPQLNRSRPARWGELTSPENLAAAARGLLAAQSPDAQLLHSRIFQRRAFPLDLSCLFAWAQSSDEKLAWAATLALDNVTHPSVRQYAFELQESRHSRRDQSIAMLSSNFEAGDHSIALRWFETEADREIRHRLGMDLRKLWERHPQPETELSMFRTLYERQTCHECREYALTDLQKLGAFTPELRAECLFDSNAEIRQMAGEADAASPLN